MDGDGEFVVASGHAAEAFETGEELFDPVVATTVVAAVEGHGLAATTQPSDADPSALPVQLRPKLSVPWLWLSYESGARGGGRTHMILRSADFESAASANSATRATLCHATRRKNLWQV